VRYLVLSDIHANLEALEATLAAAGSYDSTLILGDLVGYGADPNAVIECVRHLEPAVVIRGNHDKVAAGVEGVEGFNQIAREAIEWTSAALTPENHDWLAALPRGPVAIDETVEICHGSPFDEDVYVFDDLDALRAIRATRRPLCLFGHTHIPAIFRLSHEVSDANVGSPGNAIIDLMGPTRGTSFTVDMKENVNYLVNCGAVGQPRDGDPRAGYGIVDTDARTVVTMRIGYDVTTAQMKIIKAGLPDLLAKRLSMGR
jgi:diadenosine tetraphosphatase ApaH/serine/threonine PP2A family protein phosphatase